MKTRHTLAMMASGLGLLVLFTLASGAQEPAPSTTPSQSQPPPVRKAANPLRRVPYYFGQLGLTPDQRESIYKIVAKHQVKIDALQKQVTEERAQMVSECETVLTDTQKQLLDFRRRSNPRAQTKAASPSASAPAPAPGTSPSTPNSHSAGSSD